MPDLKIRVFKEGQSSPETTVTIPGGVLNIASRLIPKRATDALQDNRESTWMRSSDCPTIPKLAEPWSKWRNTGKRRELSSPWSSRGHNQKFSRPQSFAVQHWFSRGFNRHIHIRFWQFFYCLFSTIILDYEKSRIPQVRSAGST